MNSRRYRVSARPCSPAGPTSASTAALSAPATTLLLPAPLPVYMEGWEVGGRLRDAVVEKTRSPGPTACEARTRGIYVLIDGAEEEGGALAKRPVREARVLAGTWQNSAVVVAGRPLPELADDRERVQMPELTEAGSLALIEGVIGEKLVPATTLR